MREHLFCSQFSDYIFLLGREHGYGSLGIRAIFLDDLLSKNILHCMIQMIYFFTLAWKHGQGEWLFDLKSVFGQHIFVRAELWGREHVNESVRMGIFFCRSYDSKQIFSHWHGSIGNRSDYLFLSLFSDYIFLLWRECGDRRVEAAVWGWEQFFLRICFQNILFSSYDSNYLFFHIGMEIWREEWLFVL